MKTFARLAFAAIAFAALNSVAIAQTVLNQYTPGPRLIDGSQLNLMVDAVNNLNGNGTAGAVAGTTGTFSGAVTGLSGEFDTLTVNGGNCVMPVTYFYTGAPAATNQAFFIATRAMIITNVSQVHSVAAGGTSTLDITKDETTDAPGAGTAVTTAAFNLNATANTVQAGTLAATAVITLAAGDRLSVLYNHAIQSSAGVVVTACMAPL